MDTVELTNIRNKIDKIDYEIHDLLMQRAETVQEIILAKQNTDTPQGNLVSAYRPAREAELLKNILARHKGRLAHTTIIALWRTLLSAFCALQSDFSIAYFGSNEDEALRDAIRYYFGSAVKLKKSGTELSILHLVSNNDVTLGILPVSNVDVINEWWLKLPKDMYVSGVLPFVNNDNTVTTRNDYMIVSHSKPVPTGSDKSLFRIIGSPDVGRISIITCFTDLKQHARSLCILDSKDLSMRFHLIEVDGFFNTQEVADFINNLKKTSNGKILDVDYLGSYPAPINLLDYQSQ